ncbi:PREDICTED: MLO-like protein 9 [Camelina sativa]|uniref:MLO-like protein 9 n=1 Tax=Camelina sativa TaxID=90675 RepID=A0ABM0VYP6_CAMSA|nr:PREDICTED: MLO-like protein 9 [Camelina sativa]
MAGGGGGGGGEGPRQLDQTPTWAVSTVCGVIILISIILEIIIHKVGEVFVKKKKKALFEALEKIKSELMVLGFISLLLTFGQNYIASICVPSRYGQAMSFCGPYDGPSDDDDNDKKLKKTEHAMRILSIQRRSLADAPPVNCKKLTFQNAFEITYFFWIWYEFGLRSCFHHHFGLIIIRVCLGVGVQFLCSYITLPLYALVTQMGSTMKRSVFDEQTSRALEQWHKKARKKNEK